MNIEFYSSVIESLKNMNNTYLSLLLIFMLIDIISGLVGSWVGKITFSSVMYHGIQKKVASIVSIVFLFFVDILFGFEFNIFNTCCLLYCAYESLSIIENLSKCGVTIPNFIKERMESIKKENDGGDI